MALTQFQQFTTLRNDCFYAGGLARYLVGPMERVDSVERLTERLRTIAADGPSTRVGLLPDRGTRRWRFDPTCGAVSITEGPAIDTADPAKAITEFASSGPANAPLRIHLAGPWLLIEFDHGIGGGRLITEIIAAVGSEQAGFADPQPLTNIRYPGFRSLAHTVRKKPVQLLKALDEPRRRTAAVECTERLTEEGALVYARSAPDFLDRTREARDRLYPGTTTLAFLTSMFLIALANHGFEMEEDVHFMVDLGRYLPDGVGTLANFLGVATIKVQPPFAAPDLSASIAEYTKGCRSLVRYGMSYAAALVRTPREQIFWRTNSDRVRLVVTDHSVSGAARKINWSGTGVERIFMRMAPVRNSNQITLAINRIGAEVHLAATFYETVYERAKVHSALAEVVGALADDVSPRASL